jgi:hypothetical protein
VILAAATVVVLAATCEFATAGVCTAALIGAAAGGGFNAASYTATHINDFSMDDFLNETTTGTLVGALGGAIAEKMSLAIKAAGAARATAFVDGMQAPGLRGFFQRPIASLGRSLIMAGANVAAGGAKALVGVATAATNSVAISAWNGQKPNAGNAYSAACGALSDFGRPGALLSGACSTISSLVP